LDLLVLARGSEVWVEAGNASRKVWAEATAVRKRRRWRREEEEVWVEASGCGEARAA
jgi:hypothetical protein